MLKIEIKYIVFLILLLASCNNKNKIVELDYYNTYIKENFSSYSHVYEIAKDSLEMWKRDSLAVAKSILFDRYQLDSAMVFNNDSTRVFSTINTNSEDFKDSRMDYIDEFGGAKIGGKWYFFFIPVSEPVLRSPYQDSVYSPFTFAELSYVAHKHRFGGALVRQEDGSFESNEEWMNHHFYGTLASPSDSLKKVKEEMILKYNKVKYRGKISPKEIEERKEAMAKSVKPPEPDGEPLKFHEKLFGRHKKLFDSDRWKNRNK